MKDMEIFTGAPEEPTPSPGINTLLSAAQVHFPVPQDEFDLIEDIINEYRPPEGRVVLPEPPAPPEHLGCQRSFSEDQPSLWQNSSSTSKPVLVPRGTACKPNFLPQQHAGGSSKEMASTHPSRVVSSPGRCRVSSYSLPSKSPSQNYDTEKLEQILEMPTLKVLEEPKDRGMRFRYECEGRSAGSILGASSTDSNKTQPTVEIQGPIDHLKRTTVTVSLVTKDFPHRPHPHCLVGKDCQVGSGICKVSFNPHTSRRHSFANLGIQCVRRKELDISLQKRRSLNIDPFQTGHSKGIEDMDMNAVRLCFQCELEWEDGRKNSLAPIISKPIYDKKATTTSELKICNLNFYRGSCTGKTEIYMLCDKVQKDDIEILFKRGLWKANGEFAQTDVHRQIAIVFKTPPYQDQDITEEVEVNVVLRRISDQMESDPIAFTYLPNNRDPYEVKRKRRAIKRDVSLSEEPYTTESVSTCDQASRFPLETENRLTPDDRHSATDEAMIINELLECPEIVSALNDPNLAMQGGFDQGIDANAAFTNVDVWNYLYPADFSQFSDMQFSMLVNESQNIQPEPQDGGLQVKIEEEL
ncbi:transcription factor RelB isoform X2 [Cololabis saira]|uniref:transcription factor RelB isoform X2 n=1 Tax=Cololabis saira TaxID=129043 RepID=UPI002AD41CFD|nr:transcription factor RelB isoform X2 [Cololabis saira]